MTDPKSSKTSGYHLFLEPTGTSKHGLHHLIQQFAAEFGGPIFDPHVTLLAELQDEDETELIGKVAALVAGQSSFSVSLEALSMEDRYFRALYLRVQENEALAALHEKAEEIFSIQSSELYVPHLSLLYGNYPEARKLNALDTIYVPDDMTFLVDRVSLYKTEGEVGEWVKVQECILGTEGCKTS